MDFLQLVNMVIGVVGVFLVLLMVILVSLTKATFEWKITRYLTAVFLGFSIWAIYRFLKLFPEVTIFDYLTLIFNIGLVIVSKYASTHIDE
ncbi:hypothetical protein [Thermohalobacter berrensis]|uniref:Uncharacterized protein n=1 Tax=Thermohalobacter berrensis TaxID=99594 RepID=A0A419T0T7_9FIRM|nr:hypothetical protein [Thermohalobacter berrensis]RKD31190.1 hypothetical protein BET03_03420 [Thermohalobacter berrensis]